MSSLKNEEPHLILCCDKTIPKISENEELDSLRYQLKILKEQLHSQNLQQNQEEQLILFREENARYKLKIEKMNFLFLENEQKVFDLQLLIDKFRNAIGCLRKELQTYQTKDEEVRKERHSTQLSSAALQIQIQEQERKSDQLQIQLKNETQIKLSALEEISALHSQFEILKKRIVEAEQFFFQMQQKENHFKKLEIAQQEFDSLRVKNAEMEQILPKLHEKEKEIEQLELAQQEWKQWLEEYKAERLELNNRVIKAETFQEEAEAQLKYAHQHLAKKVRETTELTDTLKRMENQIQEFHLSASNVEERVDALQHQIDHYKEQEKNYQLQIREAKHSLHSLTSESEEKYLQIYDTLKQTESKLTELKSSEEKFKQFQAMWANLNDCFEFPIKSEENLRELSNKPYQNLFDIHCPSHTKSHFE
jgi:hypothetical protein